VNRPFGGRPPWEIGVPQPAVLALAERGMLSGRVLDVGCGTGEHTLMAASAGLDATGIDLAGDALRIATRKARERGSTARFVRHDALRLPELDEVFDTALDSLHLHALEPDDRARYLDGLCVVLRPGGRLIVLCYSEQHTTEPIPPHRMSRAELASCFTGGWTVDDIRPAIAVSNLHADGVAAWLAVCTKTRKGASAMPATEARVRTDRAVRYLTQLCEHTAKVSIHAHRHGHGTGTVPRGSEHSGTQGVIAFDGGRCTLTATAEELVVLVEADDEPRLRLIQDSIAERLRQIGRRDRLTPTWRPL
jgi:SAM-dependent methyltransferase